MKMKVSSRQYRYPDLRCHLQHAQDAAPDQLDIPINRKERTGRVRMVRV